jgi:hypothetical protein
VAHPTAIVVGTGRSGTSTTARILHEMGICMGHHLKMAKDGHHEDYLAHGLNLMICYGSVTPARWLQVMSDSHANCKRWGAKDPWFLYWSHEYLKQLAPQLIIRTWRPIEESIASWARVRTAIGKKDVDELRPRVRQLYLDRERRADELQAANGLNMIRISFAERLTDDDIRAQIEEGLAA